MPISEEQAKTVKAQIIKHIESTFPEDKRQEAVDYLNSMNIEQLEEFLVKNNMVQSDDSSKNDSKGSKDAPKGTGCVYCLISQKKIDSLPLYEDKDYMAVLEINPFSKGHTIIIPKIHIEESKKIPAKALVLAKKIGNHIIKKLKAVDFQINTSDDLKHAIVNIIPIYKGEELKYERKRAKPEELKDLSMTIGKLEKKAKIEKIKTEKANPNNKKADERPVSIIKLPGRIP